MSVCLFVCLSVCPSHFLTLLNSLFFTTSQSPMSKLFDIQNHWGKEWKGMVSDLNTLLIKGVKWPPQKNFLTDFFICSFCLNVFLSPLSKVKCPNFLDIRNSWEKVKGRNCLRLSRETLPPVWRIFFRNMFFGKKVFFCENVFFWVKICFFCDFYFGWKQIFL